MNTPKRLESQESCNAVFFTHFDCWNDAGAEWDGTHEPPSKFRLYRWQSCFAEHLLDRLFAQWVVAVPLLKQIRRVSTNCTQDEFFEICGALFVNAGYSYYLSENMFEVYDPDDL